MDHLSLQNETICSVNKENGHGYYRIHVIWGKSGFKINIASKNASWFGEMTQRMVENTCEELSKNYKKLDAATYVAECKEALATDGGKMHYSYAVENGCFTWKKLIDEDSGIKIRMGEILLEPTNFIDVIQNMLELTLQCKRDLQEYVNVLLQQNKRETERVDSLSVKLEQLCYDKLTMETDLYLKFLFLLNSKKKKIQELQKLNNKPLYSEMNNIITSQGSSEPNLLPDPYEMDTDDEIELIVKNKNKNLKSVNLSDSILHKSLSDEHILKHDESLYVTEIERLQSKTRNVCMNTHQSPDYANLQVNEFNNSNKMNSLNHNSNDESLPSTKDGLLDFFYGPSEKDE